MNNMNNMNMGMMGMNQNTQKAMAQAQNTMMMNMQGQMQQQAAMMGMMNNSLNQNRAKVSYGYAQKINENQIAALRKQQEQTPGAVYKERTIGRGIDPNEFTTIVNTCRNCYMSRVPNMSTVIANNVKAAVKGEWFVFVVDASRNDYDFSLTFVETDDFLTFTLDNTLFQICRMK